MRRSRSLLAMLPLLLLTTCLEPALAGQEESVDRLIEHLGLEVASSPVRDRPDWVEPRRVVVWAFEPERADWLRAAFPGLEILAAADTAAAARLVPGADVIIGFCDPGTLAAADRVRWVQLFSAGVERCVSLPELRQRNPLLTNMQRVAAPVMAEHVMAMVLAFARGLNRYIPQQATGEWNRDLVPEERMLTLEGKTLLVVGLGGIGTEVARRAHALGMRVLATRASSREGPQFVSYVGLPDELLALTKQADFVVNTAPLTPATTDLFDRGFFAVMKPGAYFINVGRGRSVVTADLVAALRSGGIAGAGLDVTQPEPLPADHPLWQLPNVIITPHVSTSSDLGYDDRWLIIRENLRRYLAGEPMLNVVDLERGY